MSEIERFLLYFLIYAGFPFLIAFGFLWVRKGNLEERTKVLDEARSLWEPEGIKRWKMRGGDLDRREERAKGLFAQADELNKGIRQNEQGAALWVAIGLIFYALNN